MSLCEQLLINMKRLQANKKKLTPLLNIVDTKSREIIISIFNRQGDDDRLQYTRTMWQNKPLSQPSLPLQSTDHTPHKPLTTILPVIRFIANEVDVNICSFILVEGSTLHIACKQECVKFAKNKYDSSKLKFWLSHFYFYKLRARLAQKLLEKQQNTNRQTVHVYEEKEYLPGHLNGPINQSLPLVRKLKVSSQPSYRRQGEPQKKPFCVIHGKNGRQQVVSFSQALAFADFRFNLVDLVYIRILNEVVDENSPILVSYIRKDQKDFEKDVIRKYKTVLNRTEGWEFHKNSLQSLKIQAVNSRDYIFQARILTLQIIAYIQTRHFTIVKRLEIQFILDNICDLYLSNVWIFEASGDQPAYLNEGLATFYQKFQKQKTSKITKKTYFRHGTSTPYHKFKSQERQPNTTDLLELPVTSAAKPAQIASQPKPKSAYKLRMKGRAKLDISGLKIGE